MFYPLKFSPVYKDYLWGGSYFEKFGRKLPGPKIAESWEVSCHKHGESVVANGAFEGRPLRSLIKEHGAGILGRKLPVEYGEKFPLLVKLIDANEDLSIQVHPDDIFAREHENGELGKNEMWYIIHAEPGARIYRGLRDGLKKEDVRKALEEDDLFRILKDFPVQSGDAVYVDAGTIHAIGRGIVLVEVQQNSDVTYRIHDYHRLDPSGKPRALHVDKALTVLNYACKSCKDKIAGLYDEITPFHRIKYLISNDYFTVEMLEVEDEIYHSTKGERFYIYTVVEGGCRIAAGDSRVDVKAGESVFIPAGVDNYSMNGKFKAVRAYMSLYRNELFDLLLKRGFTESEIRQAIAGYELEFCNFGAQMSGS